MKVFITKLAYDIIFKIGKRIPHPSSFGRWWFFNLTTPLYELTWESSKAGKVPAFDTPEFNHNWLIAQLGKQETDTALHLLSPYFLNLPDSVTSLKVALQRLQWQDEYLKGQPLISYIEHIKKSLAECETHNQIAEAVTAAGGADGARAILALSRYDSEEAQPRDKNTAAVAAILPDGVIIASRGKRESVELGDLYEIQEDGNRVALLRVTRVEEKMSFARPVWVSEDCPPVKNGTRLNYVEKNER